MNIKKTIIGLLCAVAFVFSAYFIVSGSIMLFCKSFLYMMQKPVNAMIIVLNVMALGCMINLLYNKFKK